MTDWGEGVSDKFDEQILEDTPSLCEQNKICNGNRTEWSPIRSVIIRVITKWMRLVDLNCNFECDWLIELSDSKLSDNKLSNNKLSDNNLASELVENRSFLNQSQSRKL